MKGAELIIKTASAAGVELCFSNPGTTELPVLEALDTVPGIRGVLGLFEGVCTGAADGYGRVAGKPALTLLHLGPGLANGIANLNNARRAFTPVLNIIGEHASWHRAADSPITMDIESLAGTVGWVRTNKAVEEMSRDTADGIGAALRGQVCSLIVPHDYQAMECPDGTICTPQFSFEPVDTESIEAAARLLRGKRKSALLLGGGALRERGLKAAARIKAAIGCDLLVETFPAYLERGYGRPVLEQIPYIPEQATALLSPYQTIVLADTREPTIFFGYKGMGSYFLTEDQKRAQLSTRNQSVEEALESLAAALNAPAKVDGGEVIKRPEFPSGQLNAKKACAVLAAMQPENAIIVEEAVTSGMAYFSLTDHTPPHSYLRITGGAIGYGMPCAVGAALASPDRPVITLEADGSAMFTLQALWTQAREGLNITTLICSNRRYQILRMELARAGNTSPGHYANALTDLSNPPIDWVGVSRGLGVPAVSANTAEGLIRELGRAQAEPGPHLIEMVL
jgi:acetolactate synthase-1/2/3 large subunit